MTNKTLEKLVKSQDVQLLTQPMELFHPTRILVMKALLNFVTIDFRDMRNNYKLSAGNLASNLRVLKKAGYINEHKEIVGKRPRTTYEITEKGRKTFTEFKECLIEVLKENENI